MEPVRIAGVPVEPELKEVHSFIQYRSSNPYESCQHDRRSRKNKWRAHGYGHLQIVSESLMIERYDISWV